MSLVLIGRQFLEPGPEAARGVIRIDPLDHGSVLEAFRRCALAVVPSLWPEPSGLVALEAMAMGKPVIASRTGGLPEVVVHGETGLLVRCGDVEELQRALRLLMSDPPSARAVWRGGPAASRAAFQRQRRGPSLRTALRLDGRTGTSMSVRERETILSESAPSQEPPRDVGATRGVTPWLTVVVALGRGGHRDGFLLVRPRPSESGPGCCALPLLGAIAVIGGPALVRMLAPSTGRSERILIVALTAVLLYWIKVLHDPVGLFLPDEFFHLANTQRLVETGSCSARTCCSPSAPTIRA